MRLGSEDDKGDVLVIKSGTDFRDLSEINIELRDAPLGSVRKKFIASIKGVWFPDILVGEELIYMLDSGKRHRTNPKGPSSEHLKLVLSTILESVSKNMKKPICVTSEPLDLRSKYIRTSEVS